MALDPNIPLAAGQGRRRANPAGEMANALAIKQAQGQIAQQDRDAQRAEAVRNALAQSIGPDGQPDYGAVRNVLLGTGDVQGALSLDESVAKRDTSQLDAAAKRLDLTAQLLGSARDEPSYQSARQRAVQMGLSIDGAPEQFDPAWVSQTLQQALSAKERLDYDLNRDKFGETKRSNRAREARGGGGLSLSVGPDGTVQFSTGGAGGGTARVPLTSSTETETQKGAVSDTGALDMVDRIARQYDPAFLTYRGRAQNAVASVADKAGLSTSEQQDLLKRRRAFSENVARQFNAYRKEITGAAATMSEIESLKESIINMDLSPAEFEASLAEYRSNIARSLRLKRRLLREGLSVGDPRFGEKLDSMFFDGSDDDARARGEELEAQRLTDEQIVNTLTREGYLQ